MKKLVESFGLYKVIAVIIMLAGVILFLLTPFFISFFNFDTDIIGVLIFLVGVVMFVVGLRRKPAGKD